MNGEFIACTGYMPNDAVAVTENHIILYEPYGGKFRKRAKEGSIRTWAIARYGIRLGELKAITKIEAIEKANDWLKEYNGN
jgi:hypothetical protein